MTVWLWLLLPAGLLVGGRAWVTRMVVPGWREGFLSETRAAVLVAASRGLTVASMVVAAVMIADLPRAPGLLTAAAVGAIYAAVGWRSIRAMFVRAGR
ncbi:MAG: hypothetical protein ACRDHD_12390 [Candidatus Limnocylindria bacterium]